MMIELRYRKGKHIKRITDYTHEYEKVLQYRTKERAYLDADMEVIHVSRWSEWQDVEEEVDETI